MKISFFDFMFGVYVLVLVALMGAGFYTTYSETSEMASKVELILEKVDGMEDQWANGAQAVARWVIGECHENGGFLFEGAEYVCLSTKELNQ